MTVTRILSVSILIVTINLGTACTSQSPDTLPPPSAPAPSATAFVNDYDYGYSTYYVASRREVPPGWGPAQLWYQQAQAAGYEVGNQPKQGAIAWTDKGQLGHVAIVESVSPDGSEVTISEMYGPGGWNVVTTRTVRADLFRYIY